MSVLHLTPSERGRGVVEIRKLQRGNTGDGGEPLTCETDELWKKAICVIYKNYAIQTNVFLLLLSQFTK
jgi:hypothetical protein